MTAPVQVGFPDWGRYSARATKVYVNAADTALNGINEPLGSFYVGDIPYLGFSMTANNPLQATIAFFADEAELIQVGHQQVEIRANGLASISIPVYGSFARFSVLAGGGNAAYTVKAWSVASPMMFGSQDARNCVLTSVTAQNVGAGATVVVTASRTWPGEAMWHFASGATAYTATVEAIDMAGAVTVLDRHSAAGIRNSHHLFLPPCPIQVRLFNGDGVLRTFDSIITARTLLPGS